MSPFHVNLGLRFAHPYESRHALLRRVLVANRGMKLAALAANLVKIMPDPPLRSGNIRGASAFLERIQALHSALPYSPLRRFVSLKDTYRRQCPQCARNLYHSDVHALPWISHCPIHHCELTLRCPVCGQRWPTDRDLPSCECPGCGIAPVSQLSYELRDADIAPIAVVYKFAVDYRPEYAVCGWDLHERDAIAVSPRDEIGVASPLFAACQALRRPVFSPARLDALHIIRPPAQLKATSLVEASKTVLSRPYGDDFSVSLRGTSRQRVLTDFRAMRRIIAWIRDQAPDHEIRLSDYRGLPCEYNFRRHEPCPYCFALSIWFARIATLRYGRYYLITDQDYPSIRDSFFPILLAVREPYVTVGLEQYFLPETWFSNWFYGRGLEILFLSILEWALFWILRPPDIKSLHISDAYFHIFRHTAAARLCTSALQDNHLILYYQNEHPLEHFEPPHMDNVGTRCQKYAQHECTTLTTSETYSHAIPSTPFTLEEFLRIHRRFGACLLRDTPPLWPSFVECHPRRRFPFRESWNPEKGYPRALP